MPIGADRRALDARALALRESMAPAPSRAIAARVAQMFLRFPSSRIADDKWDATAAVYVLDLSGFPIWAIDRGCAHIVASRAGRDAGFAPSSIELRAAAERAVTDARNELAGIQKVLGADVYHEPTASDKAKMAEGFQELIRDLGLNEPLDGKKRGGMTETDKRATAAILAGMPDPRLVPMMSARLRAVMGIYEKTEDRVPDMEGRA